MEVLESIHDGDDNDVVNIEVPVVQDAAEAVHVSEDQVFQKPALESKMAFEVEHYHEVHYLSLVLSLHLVHHIDETISKHKEELRVKIGPHHAMLVKHRSRHEQSTQHRHDYSADGHLNQERVVYLALEH